MYFKRDECRPVRNASSETWRFLNARKMHVHSLYALKMHYWSCNRIPYTLALNSLVKRVICKVFRTGWFLDFCRYVSLYFMFTARNISMRECMFVRMQFCISYNTLKESFVWKNPLIVFHAIDPIFDFPICVSVPISFLRSATGLFTYSFSSGPCRYRK